MKKYVLIIAGWLVLGCGLNAQAETLPTIEFVLADDNLQQFGFKPEASQIAERVRANLTEWQFPLQAVGPFTHQLQARLGKIGRQATPVGFSFSRGNSDPRAADFQKADVLPISCRLSDGSGNLLLDMESSFSAHAFERDAKPEAVTNKLIDQISTACLDVLEKAPLAKPEGQAKTSSFKPKWMPDVRVEVKEVPSVSGNVSGSALKEEARKEVIIHNQGTPVIFQFGHERR